MSNIVAGPYRLTRATGRVPAAALDVDRLVARPDAEVLQRGERATVVAVDLDGEPCVVKQFRERAWKVILFGSSGRQVWDAAARVRSAGFPVPEMLAVLERRVFGLARWSCTIARRVRGLALDDAWTACPPERRSALAEALADYLRGLHGAGLYPQDVRGANIIVTDERPPRFVLVDLDRVRRYGRLSWTRRNKNLAQVLRSVGRNARATERLRFLSRYLGDVPRGELRRRAADVLALGRAKDAEYARRRGELRSAVGGRVPS